jgi:hypothetical protein
VDREGTGAAEAGGAGTGGETAATAPGAGWAGWRAVDTSPVESATAAAAPSSTACARVGWRRR